MDLGASLHLIIIKSKKTIYQRGNCLTIRDLGYLHQLNKVFFILGITNWPKIFKNRHDGQKEIQGEKSLAYGSSSISFEALFSMFQSHDYGCTAIIGKWGEKSTQICFLPQAISKGRGNDHLGTIFL